MSRNSKFSEIFLHNLKGKKINKVKLTMILKEYE